MTTTFVFLALIVGLVAYLIVTSADLEFAQEGEGFAPAGNVASEGSAS